MATATKKATSKKVEALPKEIRITTVVETVGFKVETPLGLVIDVKYDYPTDTYPSDVQVNSVPGRSYVCASGQSLIEEAIDLEEKELDDIYSAIKAIHTARKAQTAKK